jgi:hypothetical protein
MSECGEGCPCLEPTTEELVEGICRHNPEGVCIEKDGKCERVPCCKNKPGESAEEGW